MKPHVNTVFVPFFVKDFAYIVFNLGPQKILCICGLMAMIVITSFLTDDLNGPSVYISMAAVPGKLVIG